MTYQITLQKINHHQCNMKRTKASPKLVAKAKAIRTHKQKEIELEPGESVENINVPGPGGQEVPLISYCFVHPQFGMTYRIEAPTIDVCRRERNLWMARNDLITKKRRRRAEPEGQ